MWIPECGKKVRTRVPGFRSKVVSNGLSGDIIKNGQKYAEKTGLRESI